MQLSYWEQKHWFQNLDFTIIGSGIVGLQCALQLRSRFPKAKILMLEKGVLPQGASTKNAGFACFGSLSEIKSDLQTHTLEEIICLVHKRWQGLQMLRAQLGDQVLNYKNHGGYELFLEEDTERLEQCLEILPQINQDLKSIFDSPVFSVKSNPFGFKNIHPQLLFNAFEGQLDTGAMMQALLKQAIVNNIHVLHGIEVHNLQSNVSNVTVTLADFSFDTDQVFVATNGFAQSLLNLEVSPARAQVLITKPIENLHIKGTFHIEEGYYYFRNIDDRILFGGGRNLDITGETTTDFGTTHQIQNQLEYFLKTIILPDTPFEIDHRWSGIMGVGNQKKPMIKRYAHNIHCGVRLGGMGVAIGSLVGKELADLI